MDGCGAYHRNNSLLTCEPVLLDERLRQGHGGRGRTAPV